MEFLDKYHLIFLMSSAFVMFCPAHTSPTPPPRQDIVLWSSASSVYQGFTRYLVLNCSFNQQQNSEFGIIMSVILSKAPIDDQDNFREIAIVNYFHTDSVTVKTPLNADVTGQLNPQTGIFIQYHWDYPSNDVIGVYKCVAHGMDIEGHPGSVVTSTTITKRNVSLDMVLQKFQTMEITQENLLHQLNTTQSQLTITQSQLTNTVTLLNNTMAELTNTKNELNSTKIQLTNDLNNTKNQLTKTELELNVTKTELTKELEKTKIELEKLDEEKNSTQLGLADLQSRVNSSLSLLFQKSLTFNHHVYHLSYPVSYYMHIDQIEQICELMGGYLVEIGDQAEYDIVVDLIKTAYLELGDYYNTFIGMSDKEKEGTWRYIHSRSLVTFTRWAEGEPDSGSGENCAVLEPGSYLMYDYSCYNSVMRYMCEVE